MAKMNEPASYLFAICKGRCVANKHAVGVVWLIMGVVCLVFLSVANEDLPRANT